LDDYINDIFQPIPLVQNLEKLTSKDQLAAIIKGGGVASKPEERDEESEIEDLDDYINELFEPIPVAEGLDKLTSKEHLAVSIRGGGSTDSNGADPLLHQLMQLPGETESGPALYQQQVQRAFLQSAMAQNLQIQQQLLAQNQALQTLLSQQAAAAAANNSTSPPPAPPILSSLSISPPPPQSPMRMKATRSSLVVMESLQPPPPPRRSGQ